MLLAGMFGLGGMELLILALFFGAPLVAGIVVLIVLSRRSGSSSARDYNALRAENERLRDEIDRLRRGQ
jgi:cell division protein FtsB